MEPKDAQWVIQTRISKVWLRADNIIYWTFTVPLAEETLEDAIQTQAQIKAKVLGKKYPAFIDLTDVKSVSNEAKAYHAGPETAEDTLASALLVPNPVAKVIGTFFIGLNKPIQPVKLFTDKDEALAWLKTFLP